MPCPCSVPALRSCLHPGAPLTPPCPSSFLRPGPFSLLRFLPRCTRPDPPQARACSFSSACTRPASLQACC
jgi:hypothetical protein